MLGVTVASGRARHNCAGYSALDLPTWPQQGLLSTRAATRALGGDMIPSEHLSVHVAGLSRGVEHLMASLPQPLVVGQLRAMSLMKLGWIRPGAEWYAAGGTSPVPLLIWELGSQVTNERGRRPRQHPRPPLRGCLRPPWWGEHPSDNRHWVFALFDRTAGVLFVFDT